MTLCRNGASQVATSAVNNLSMMVQSVVFRQQEANAFHVTNALHWAAKCIQDRTGIPFQLISARSLRPGGPTALLCANVHKQSFQLICHWKVRRHLCDECQTMLLLRHAGTWSIHVRPDTSR